MTGTTCWSIIDSNVLESDNASLCDLFGDELLNVYNTIDGSNKDTSTDSNTGEEYIGVNDNNALDFDALSGVRHSSSLNDFASILEDTHAILPSMVKAVPMEVKSVPTAAEVILPEMSVENPSNLADASSGKKRKVDNTSMKKEATPQKKTKSFPQIIAKTEDTSKSLPAVSVKPRQISVDLVELATRVAAAKSVTELGNPGTLPVIPGIVNSLKISLPTSLIPEQARATTPDTLVSKPMSKTVIVSPFPSTPTVSIKAASQAKLAQPDLASSDSSLQPLLLKKHGECFKDIAKAAVTNLMSNAATHIEQSISLAAAARPINTSTSHVNALASDSWVAACAASIGADVSPGTARAAQVAAFAASSAASKAAANARAKRAALTTEDRAKQARDRNREHARNTRLRKKAYVEELKRTLTELVLQRDAAETEKRNEVQRDIETREVRFKVMNEFLRLRASSNGQNSLPRWIAILGDQFNLTLPQNLPTDPASPQAKVLHGAQQCFDDAKKFASFMYLLYQGDNTVEINYHCERSTFIMDGIRTMFDWTLKAIPSSTTGKKYPSFVIRGQMRATFIAASNKLASAELMFDTQHIADQVQNIKAQQEPFSISGDDVISDHDDAILPPHLQLHLRVPSLSNILTIGPPDNCINNSMSAPSLISAGDQSATKYA
mmetsp:Transcript_19125/g.28146  ORF Transcript_19125/g.28146 Transcript_19125/m.28146 type:complete len:667 (-) Transcript_19125:234-2234(-)|eukprot:CAMPEP_0194086064 /NCGR_PEP_ID=MMETSP0149-20130528/19839_1 /TAXON_ID=122233 /ORGANISM="Chaetoceros debilis, Strain MM31A-1" /LENGTH=666 /DNA_ID=CAMNT_0038769075 /DNA_START=54 /DNA_END=2054 /DNA_ORIENTATION=-